MRRRNTWVVAVAAALGATTTLLAPTTAANADPRYAQEGYTSFVLKSNLGIDNDSCQGDAFIGISPTGNVTSVATVWCSTAHRYVGVVNELTAGAGGSVVGSDQKSCDSAAANCTFIRAEAHGVQGAKGVTYCSGNAAGTISKLLVPYGGHDKACVTKNF
jgi:hypothetical protein